jgi:hypothetical protein
MLVRLAIRGALVRLATPRQWDRSASLVAPVEMLEMAVLAATRDRPTLVPQVTLSPAMPVVVVDLAVVGAMQVPTRYPVERQAILARTSEAVTEAPEAIAVPPTIIITEAPAVMAVLAAAAPPAAPVMQGDQIQGRQAMLRMATVRLQEIPGALVARHRQTIARSRSHRVERSPL